MSAFTEALETRTEGLKFVSVGATAHCEDCARAWDVPFGSGVEIEDEGHFSWRPCEGCGSTFGGNRYAAHGTLPEGKVVHFDVCEDCLCYLANGDEPRVWGT